MKPRPRLRPSVRPLVTPSHLAGRLLTNPNADCHEILGWGGEVCGKRMHAKIPCPNSNKINVISAERKKKYYLKATKSVTMYGQLPLSLSLPLSMCHSRTCLWAVQAYSGMRARRVVLNEEGGRGRPCFLTLCRLQSWRKMCVRCKLLAVVSRILP